MTALTGALAALDADLRRRFEGAPPPHDELVALCQRLLAALRVVDRECRGAGAAGEVLRQRVLRVLEVDGGDLRDVDGG